MAKISTYPIVSVPDLSDILIGSVVGDGNETKNFRISDILGLVNLSVYVPYIGATSGVDLGSYGIIADSLNLDNGLSVNGGASEFYGPVQMYDAVTFDGIINDGSGSPGTPGQVLVSNGATVSWQDYGLQEVLDAGDTADGDINLTGATNAITQSGANALIKQDGSDASIKQDGANAYIKQSGLGAYFSQTGDNAYIKQDGLDAYINQSGLDAYIQQTGDNALIKQEGAGGAIRQTGFNCYIEQTGSFAFIQQSGTSAYIQQDGASARIEQTNPSAYIKPAQIRDSTNSSGVLGETLVSLGPGNGVEWQEKHQIGSFYDTTSQTTTVGVAVPMKFGDLDIAGFGVAVSTDISLNKTQIQVTESGYYNIQFSAQIRNGAGAAEVDIWFRKNGVNIPNSNTVVTMQSNSSGVAAWNYLVKMEPADIVQIMWTQNNNNAFLVAAAAVSPHPATPSTILTVNRVR